MRFLRFVFVVFVLGAFSNSSLLANEEVQELKLLEDSIENPSLTQKLADSKKPNSQETKRIYVHFPSTANFQPSKSIFFQTNIGVGFLYFSGLRANLMGRPVGNFNPSDFFRDAPLKGRLSYNRTPLFEYLLGFRFNPWLKLALSYQYQAGVTIQTKALSSYPNAGGVSPFMVQFTSSLSLNALLAKVYFELPFAIICRNLSINPYLAVGVGPGWQSWTEVIVDYFDENGVLGSARLPLRQKISANAVWMVDMGLRLQRASSSNRFSVLMGCKYNQWGQARNIGEMSQRGTYKIALTQPLRIKTVYQFAPYLGVQWNFVPDRSAGASYKLKGKNPKVWLPYWVASKEFQCPRGIWTQFNAGIGFLYFSGLRGNLMGQPVLDFLPSVNFRDIPLKGRLSYNRTPLLEYLLGYRFNSWLKLALSYQHQGGIIVQSKALSAFPTAGVAAQNERGQFVSNLALDALLAKVYFELPFSIIWKSLSMNPYLAVGIGPGWQSWTWVQAYQVSGNTSHGDNSPVLRQKISANAVWMADLGFRIQSGYPGSLFSVFMGCKYNQWGQARSIGKMSQQGAHKISITQPLRIKTVYQFAPYLGVQWNFSPDQSAGSSYKLKGKNPKVWLPYWVASKEFQCPTSIWTQFNAGIGFLYFSGLRGNLMEKLFTVRATEYRDSPLKGRLSYNRTPLFEYLLGYQFSSWLRVALSYQYQGGISITTKALHPFPDAATSFWSQYIQFMSRLSLNAILTKVYFELPFSMIWRSLATNPYIAVGVGPGWQSWTRVTVDYSLVSNNFFTSGKIPLRQKISANAVWMVDAGLRIQSAYPNSKFSVLLGCKYNQWGQARSIGKMSQQGSHKFSITQPLRIKTVYQFAPYLGVQWSF